jgi:hypothetical protein
LATAHRLTRRSKRPLGGIGDYFKPPRITGIVRDAYHGRIGDKIAIVADDDVGVLKLTVAIHDANTHALVESGEAVPVGEDCLEVSVHDAPAPLVRQAVGEESRQRVEDVGALAERRRPKWHGDGGWRR